MQPRPEKLSQSSLQDYADCHRRFQLRYLEQLVYPASESEPALENERHILMGQAFHRLVQQNLVGIPQEKLETLVSSPELQGWWENFLAFKRSKLIAQNELLPETTLSAPLPGVRLIAKYDLISISKDGGFTIFDWKTYRTRPRKEWLAARWQTRVYPALLVTAGPHLNRGKPIPPERCEMVYWFANFPDDPAHFSYNEAKYQRDWKAISSLSEEIQSASDYPLTDDRQKCLFCPYRSYCDRGIEAGKLETLEAEMDAEELFDLDFEQIGEIEF